MTTSVELPRIELQAKKALLKKADLDIASGKSRLNAQRTLVQWLDALGHDARQARRLAELMEQSLAEWKRHRELVLARISHLESGCRH